VLRIQRLRSKMKNIAFVTYDNHKGGASMAVARLAKGISRYSKEVNAQVTIVANDIEENNDSAGKKAIRLIKNKPIIDKVVNKLSIRAWLRLHGVQNSPRKFWMSGYKSILQELNKYDLTNLFWIQNFARLGDINKLEHPIVITLHDMWFLTGGCSYSLECNDYVYGCKSCKYISKPFKRNCADQYELKTKILERSGLKIVVTSDWMAEKAIQRGIDDKKLIRINNFIPENYVYMMNKRLAREILGLKEGLKDHIILYFVGDISDERKGFDLLFKSLHRVKTKIRGSIIIMHLGPINRKYDDGLGELGIEIIHLGMFRDEQSQVVAYNSADFLVCPSRFDNSPNVIAEAHMCGLPTITSETTGCAEMVDHGVNGMICNVQETVEFGSAIEDAIRNRHMFISELISKKARSEYGYEATCAKYLHLYNSII